LPLALGPSDQLLGLAGGGVCPAGIVTDTAVRSYRTISPLPVPIGTSAVYFLWHFPVPINREVAVSHHRALSCSDFPPPFLSSTEDTGAIAQPALFIGYLLLIIVFYLL